MIWRDLKYRSFRGRWCRVLPSGRQSNSWWTSFDLVGGWRESPFLYLVTYLLYCCILDPSAALWIYLPSFIFLWQHSFVSTWVLYCSYQLVNPLLIFIAFCVLLTCESLLFFFLGCFTLLLVSFFHLLSCLSFLLVVFFDILTSKLPFLLSCGFLRYLVLDVLWLRNSPCPTSPSPCEWVF